MVAAVIWLGGYGLVAAVMVWWGRLRYGGGGYGMLWWRRLYVNILWWRRLWYAGGGGYGIWWRRLWYAVVAEVIWYCGGGHGICWWRRLWYGVAAVIYVWCGLYIYVVNIGYIVTIYIVTSRFTMLVVLLCVAMKYISHFLREFRQMHVTSPFESCY
jgi:hypothetical protein